MAKTIYSEKIYVCHIKHTKTVFASTDLKKLCFHTNLKYQKILYRFATKKEIFFEDSDYYIVILYSVMIKTGEQGGNLKDYLRKKINN